MATEDLAAGETRAPASCTLPTVERPPRTAEFDELFATAVRPHPAVAAQAADLMARPATRCCAASTSNPTGAG